MRLIIKIKNETNYSTRQLKSFFLVGFKSMASKYKVNQPVRVVWVLYSRKEMHWGCASLAGERDGTDGRSRRWDGKHITMTVPKGGIDTGQLARVWEHELAHTFGVMHGDMTDSVRYCRNYTPSWASGVFATESAAPDQAALKPAAPKPSKADKALKELAHANDMMSYHQSAERRHNNLVAKWKRKRSRLMTKLDALSHDEPILVKVRP